jgi:hypothetical protein
MSYPKQSESNGSSHASNHFSELVCGTHGVTGHVGTDGTQEWQQQLPLAGFYTFRGKH